MRMRRVTWPGGKGHPKPHYGNQQPQFPYSLYNFYGAKMTFKGSLHGASPIVKCFWPKVSSKADTKMADFRD